MRKAEPFDGKAHKRTVDDTRNERDSGYGRLHEYKDNRNLTVHWDFNEATKEAQIFMLRIGSRNHDKLGGTIEVLIDKEEILRYLRWV